MIETSFAPFELNGVKVSLIERRHILELTSSSLIIANYPIPHARVCAFIAASGVIHTFVPRETFEDRHEFSYAASFQADDRVPENLSFLCDGDEATRGYIELVGEKKLEGWAANYFIKSPLQVALKVDGVVRDIVWASRNRGDILAANFSSELAGYEFDVSKLGHPFSQIEVEVLGVCKSLQWVRNTFDVSIWPERRRAAFKQRNFRGLEFELARSEYERRLRQASEYSDVKNLFDTMEVEVEGPVAVYKLFEGGIRSESMKWLRSLTIRWAQCSDNELNKRNHEFFKYVRRVASPECEVSLLIQGEADERKISAVYSDSRCEASGTRGRIVKVCGQELAEPAYAPNFLTPQFAFASGQIAGIEELEVQATAVHELLRAVARELPIVLISEAENFDSIDAGIFRIVFSQDPIVIEIGRNSCRVSYNDSEIRYILAEDQSLLQSAVAGTIQEISVGSQRSILLFAVGEMMQNTNLTNWFPQNTERMKIELDCFMHGLVGRMPATTLGSTPDFNPFLVQRSFSKF